MHRLGDCLSAFLCVRCGFDGDLFRLHRVVRILLLADICSIEEDGSSAAAACSLAPCESFSEPEDICWLPAATLSEAHFTSFTTSESFAKLSISRQIIYYG